jgi:3-hydroxyisobutyrate dehydrogenase-like beta-hydroxyacid dehydrogenase
MSQQPVIAVVAPGQMGAGLGRRLTETGCRVLTSLDGRGEASRRRAAEAGMEDASDQALCQADLLLSVIPPAEALAFAQRMAPALAVAARKPVFVDCNAISPEAARDVAAVIEATGTPFVDGGIVGNAPRPGYSPSLYASGPRAAALETLARHGLTLRILPGPVGKASALKLCYAAVNKGLYAIGLSAILGAVEAGVEDALLDELARSQPHVLSYLAMRGASIFPKTWRWGPEMREIARFLGGPGETIYEGAAELYDLLAEDHAGDRAKATALLDFLGRAPKKA